MFFYIVLATISCRSSAAGSGCSWGEYNGTCMHRDRCLSLIKDSRLEETAPNEDDSPVLMNGQVSRCQDTLLGVTSRGGSCVTRGTPVLLTRVEHYVLWIESVVWSEAA